ncbi:MAG: trimethylamine methyltransferase family protein [Pseudomonadota bacterium]
MRRTRVRRQAGPGSAVPQMPFGQVENPFQPMKVLSDDQVEAIHQASLTVLRDIGMDFQLREAVEILRRAGAAVAPDGVRVRFPPGFVDEKLRTVPAHFTLHGRSANRHLAFGGGRPIWATVASTPNVSDRERGRITGTLAEMSALTRLAHVLNPVHAIAGYVVEPTDLEVRTRHLTALSTIVKITDKPFFAYAFGRERMRDGIEIARLARGVSHEALARQPSLHTVVNANTPLIYDGALLEGAIEMARMNQPVIYTPFTLAGAMTPITLAAALVQQNAEALAGIAFSQCVNPGAPAVYGSFTSNADMKTGSPVFGTPEYAKATIASGQLARRYKIPWRSSNVTASNAADVQAAYEAQMSIWPITLGQADYINHGFGWIEGGLSTSYEKMVIDAEMVQMMNAFLTPISTSESDLGLDAIAEVGPGGHFFASPHTLERYETAFYTPLLSDWRNFENWRDSGSLEASDRATRIWKALLADYEEPPMDPAIKEALDDFVARRIAEGGAPPL